MALDAPYPFWVLCPGNDIDEIIKVICQLESSVEQIILLIVPSAIAHLHLRASQLKQSLPVKKLRYLVGGEPFPETLPKLIVKENCTWVGCVRQSLTHQALIFGALPMCNLNAYQHICDRRYCWLALYQAFISG